MWQNLELWCHIDVNAMNIGDFFDSGPVVSAIDIDFFDFDILLYDFIIFVWDISAKKTC